MLERERERLAAASRRLAQLGLAHDTSGNISLRAGDRIVVTPTGAALERLDAAQIAVVDLDGTLVEGPLEATSELALHLGAYRRLGAGAVVHAHPPVATALACVIDELPLVHYQMVAFGGPVRVARYETFGTERLADVTLDALEGRTAVLMANHGALAWGSDLEQAMQRTRLLEWVSDVYWRASALGTPRTLGPRELDAARERMRDYRPLAGPRASEPAPAARAAETASR